MFHFSCSAVAALRLEVAMEHKRTYLLARTTGKTTARPPVFVCRSSKFKGHGSRLQDFCSERLITEVEKRPALYNKATPEYSDKHYKEKLWIEVCEALVSNGHNSKSGNR